MKRLARQRTLLLAAALAMLSLRALTPAGYMPGSPGSGLLFELCPAGVPAAVMQALGAGHHHHHGNEKSSSATEHCPIGHMLSTTAALDVDPQVGLVPTGYESATVPVRIPAIVGVTAYRSRAPPA